MCALCFLRARFSEEGQRDLAHRVEGGEERGNRKRDEDGQVARERVGEDFILRPKARGDDRETRKRKAADEERPKRDGHFVFQAAHVEHVLRVNFMIPRVKGAMLHAMNDRT